MAKHIPDHPAAQDASAETEIIPLAEQELHLDKQEVVTGKVRVRTVTDVEDELAQAMLDEETVDVTRVPVDRMVDRAPEVRTENGVTIVPILEEVLVVEKRLVLKEELHIRKQIRTEKVEFPVQRRKQRAIVERIPVDRDEDDDSL